MQQIKPEQTKSYFYRIKHFFNSSQASQNDISKQNTNQQHSEGKSLYRSTKTYQKSNKTYSINKKNKKAISGKYNQNIRGFGISNAGITIIGLNGSLTVSTGGQPIKLEPVRKKLEEGQKRILCMFSNTGGGHKASADALKSALEEKYGDKYQMYIADVWSDWTAWPINQLPKSYSFLVKHGFLWRLTYTISYPKVIHKPYLRTLGLFGISKNIDKAYEHYNPSLVISVHPLLQHIPIRVLQKRIRAGVQDPNTAFATVVTDFTTCHSTWFHPSVDKCFVATPECKALALLGGLKNKQITVHGLPIRPSFLYKLPQKPQLRANLGLDPAKTTILITGGGEGMGKLKDTVDQLVDKLSDDTQITVVCGRNKKLQQQLLEPKYQQKVKVQSLGFIDNLHEHMGASDLIITKAGPGTIAESLVSGLPILLNGNVPCQEEGNIPYVINNKVGTFERNPEQIAKIVDEWLQGDRYKLKEMAEKSISLGKPKAVYKIVDDLVKLCSKKVVV